MPRCFAATTRCMHTSKNQGSTLNAAWAEQGRARGLVAGPCALARCTYITILRGGSRRGCLSKEYRKWLLSVSRVYSLSPTSVRIWLVGVLINCLLISQSFMRLQGFSPLIGCSHMGVASERPWASWRSLHTWECLRNRGYV